jgi:putative ABC transport system ATP-binding protein
VLRLENIDKIFRTSDVETTALKRVNLHVETGEFVAIMGPSGCGKSTLLNIIGLLDSSSSGSYRFLGDEVSTHPERRLAWLRRRNIGFIFQSFNLIDELTVFGNVELPLLYQNVSASERHARAEAALQKAGIMSRRNHLPQELSGGQQQRVAVARAIVTRPKLILADEPTGNLDSANGENVMNTLVNLNTEGTTIVIATHSHAHARYAHRTVPMFDGEVLTISGERASLQSPVRLIT